jgi:acyl carrier protein
MKVEIDEIILVMKDVFENNNLLINHESKAADIEEWDSLNHIYLIVEIEKKFNIKFKTNQIQGWQCVGDLLSDINKNLNNVI